MKMIKMITTYSTEIPFVFFVKQRNNIIYEQKRYKNYQELKNNF